MSNPRDKFASSLRRCDRCYKNYVCDTIFDRGKLNGKTLEVLYHNLPDKDYDIKYSNMRVDITVGTEIDWLGCKDLTIYYDLCPACACKLRHFLEGTELKEEELYREENNNGL